MRIIFLFLIFSSTFSSHLYSQSIFMDIGAKSKGIGNSNTNIADEWSIFNNVGGLSGVESGRVFFGYDRYFGIDGFNKIAVGVIHTFDFGNIGASVYKFGDDLYSEQISSIAFGNKIGFVRLGIKANYYQLRIEDFGTIGSVFFDFGGIVELIPKLSFGAFISNFTLSKLNDSNYSRLPVLLKVGLSYNPSKTVILNLDLYKDIDYKPIVRAGIEYIIIEKFYLRTGINTNPIKNFFGIGIILEKFQIDYAVSTHQLLGTSHQASISFIYQNRNEN